MSREAKSARIRRTGLAGIIVGAVMIAAPPADAIADNDFYEQPFGVLFSGEPVFDVNTAAGIQPGEPLTPAGPGSCGSAARKIVATKWYRFIGNGGTISVNTVGSDFDTVIAAYEGPTPRSDDPLPCSDDAAGARTSALSFPSVAGRAYLVQVGGCSACGTPIAGSIVLNVAAAPPPPPPPPPPTPPPPPPPPEVIDARSLLATDSYYDRVAGGRIRYLGLEIRSLRVTRLPPGTRVEVNCTRRACRRQVQIAGTSRQVVFRYMRGRDMRAGTRIVVRATLPGWVGAHIRYRIRRNRLSKVERCLPPGDPRPQKC